MKTLSAPTTWTFIAVFSILGLLTQAVPAATYYVTVSGSGSGTSWGDAFGTIQSALDQIYDDVDTNAVVYIEKTSSTPYSSASKTYTNSPTIRFLGGYDSGTSIRDGISEISGAGVGLYLGTSSGTDPDHHVGTFVLSCFRINTTSYGLQSPENNAYNYGVYVVSNSTITTTSTTDSPIYLPVIAASGTMDSLTLDACIVQTPTNGTQRAVHVKGTNNRTYPKLVEVRNGSVITADTTANTLDAYCNKLILTDSVVTNAGSGRGAYAGRAGWGGAMNHQIINSTIHSSGGNGLYLTGDQLKSGGIPATIENSTIRAVGAYGVYAYVAASQSYDTRATDLLITNSTIINTGTDGYAIHCYDNYGPLDLGVYDSTIHGAGRAVYYYAPVGGNRKSESMAFHRTTLSAGAEDGGVNSTNAVLYFHSGDPVFSYGNYVVLNQSVVKNGAGGIYASSKRDIRVYMTNSVITDQEAALGDTGYGVLADGIERSVLVRAYNCTFSDLEGPVLQFEEVNTGQTLAATLMHTAIAPGGNTTNFVNNDADDTLTLSGGTNAFYQYGTFSDGTTINNMAASDNQPSGDPGLSNDGYHLLQTSPLIDTYGLSAGVPVIDIDDQERPLGLNMDIGADEFEPPAGTLIFIK